MNAVIRSYCRIGLGLIAISVGFVGCGTTTKPETKPPVLEPKFTGLVIEQGPGSLGAEPRKETVTCLILHHTAGSLPSSLEILQGKDPKHKVGVHYVVTDEPKPRVIRMVPENLAAYHAGKSAWGKLTNLNQNSIGIEIINYDGNVYTYSDAQAEILFALCAEIIRRHDIKPWNVLAHSDIAVGRKVDPGLKFPWAKLASLGIGAWPLPNEVAENLAKKNKLAPNHVRGLLVAYGYVLEPGDAGLKLGVEAFQRHFRPSKVDGLIDNETVAILEALLRRYQPKAYREVRFKP
ncbi:MAG: N-acetylmuramoyl-L-alanine amidase [Verrucomicrobia bacterium]|jgi:N-acetyl-anhydromuramyl-L-alanine amidase AmpD|nr:N-acetylmuramoyl-L-alanine amidase [Verrucomicrobiota bacterium]